MSYKTILAYVDEGQRCTSLISMARGLGERHGAHVIGLHVMPAPQIYYTAEYPLSATQFQDQREQTEKVAKGAKSAFEEGMKGAKCEWEWRSVEQGMEAIGERVMEHGLVCDLVVTGQIDPSVDSPRRVGAPEEILLHGGRPILMVPYVGEYPNIGRRIMVAWRAGGEAARATFDALPLLKEAEQVTVLTVDPSEQADLAGVATGAELAATLARHGVKAKAENLPSGDIGVANAILSRLSDEGQDLLVMGGYGHSRLNEFLFGGATRQILHEMTVPVLLSH